MKAKLYFDLDEPFERSAHLRCLKATDAYLLLYDMQRKLCSIRDEEKNKVFQEIYDFFFERMERYSINLDNEIE